MNYKIIPWLHIQIIHLEVCVREPCGVAHTYNPVPKRLRQEDHCEFQTVKATKWDLVSKEKESECAIQLAVERLFAGVTMKKNSN